MKLTCRICKKIKSADRFKFRTDTLTYRTECRLCHSKQKRKMYLKNRKKILLWQKNHRLQFPKRYENGRLLRYYGITLAEFNKLRKKQKNKCAICGLSEKRLGSSQKTRPLSVDHCHTSKIVRGLLCGKCNLALGCFNDNPKILRNAAKYIERTR